MQFSTHTPLSQYPSLAQLFALNAPCLVCGLRTGQGGVYSRQRDGETWCAGFQSWSAHRDHPFQPGWSFELLEVAAHAGYAVLHLRGVGGPGRIPYIVAELGDGSWWSAYDWNHQPAGAQWTQHEIAQFVQWEREEEARAAVLEAELVVRGGEAA